MNNLTKPPLEAEYVPKDTRVRIKNELDVPAHLIPKNKKLAWIRYAHTNKIKSKDDLDIEHIVEHFCNGYQPVLAVNYQPIMTEAKRNISTKYVMYGRQVLCELSLIGAYTVNLIDTPLSENGQKVYEAAKQIDVQQFIEDLTT